MGAFPQSALFSWSLLFKGTSETTQETAAHTNAPFHHFQSTSSTAVSTVKAIDPADLSVT